MNLWWSRLSLCQWLIEFETEAVKCWNRMINVKDIFGLWFIQLQREEKSRYRIRTVTIGNFQQWDHPPKPASLLTESIFAFTHCSWAGDRADFYLHLFQLQHLFYSQLSFPEILLKLPLGTMEISDSLCEEPAAGPSPPFRWYIPQPGPLSQQQRLRNTLAIHGRNPFPARNLITIALTWDGKMAVGKRNLRLMCVN